MAAIQIKDVPDEFLRELKLAAACESKTLKQYVMDTLTPAVTKTILPRTLKIQSQIIRGKK